MFVTLDLGDEVAAVAEQLCHEFRRGGHHLLREHLILANLIDQPRHPTGEPMGWPATNSVPLWRAPGI